MRMSQIRTSWLIASVLIGGACLMIAAVPWMVSAQDRTGERATRNERLYGFRGVIAGRVTFADDRPARGFRVVARFVTHQTGAPGEGEATTDADGRYEIRGLNPQNFHVAVENGGKPYIVPSPRRVDLRARTDGVDFVLRLGPQITVRVRDAQTGRPIAGMTVEANPALYASPAPVGTTDARGEFQFRAGQLEVEMRLRAGGSLAANIEAAPGYSFYHTLHLTPGQDVTWDVKTYQQALQSVLIHFHGTVIGPNGAPVAEALVRMLRNSDEQRAMTDEAGRFTFQGPRITQAEHQQHGIILRADKGGLSAVKFLTAKESWGNIVVRMYDVQRPSLTGVVTDAEGRPEVGVPILCMELFPGMSSQLSIHNKNGGITDDEGRFTITDLSPDGVYQLHFGGWPQYPGGSPNFGRAEYPEVKYTRDWLRLHAGECRNIGRMIVPTADAVIAGRVIGPEGAPTPLPVAILIRGKHTEVYPELAVDGRFRAEHLVREPLMLGVYAVHDRYFRTGPDSPDLIYQMPLHARDENVRIVLPADMSGQGH